MATRAMGGERGGAEAGRASALEACAPRLLCLPDCLHCQRGAWPEE